MKHTDRSRHVKSISKNKQSTIQRQIHVSIQNQQAEGKEYKCTCTVSLSLSLNSERNGIIILASKQRLLQRIAPEMFKAVLEKLYFQAQTYM